MHPGQRRDQEAEGKGSQGGMDLRPTRFLSAFSLSVSLLASPFPFSLLSPLSSLTPGGTLWSHLLSQACHQQPDPRQGSNLETSRKQPNNCLSFRTPTALPLRYLRLQDQPFLGPLQTCGSLRLAGKTPTMPTLRGAEGSPLARPGTACPLNLPKAPSGCLGVGGQRGRGQSLDTATAPPWGLSWVRQGADRVLGGCGRGRGQGPPSVGGANSRRCSGGAWTVREEQAKQWAAETLVALEALHAQGILCQDLNPRNLLLDQAGEGTDRWPTRPVPHPGPLVFGGISLLSLSIQAAQ